MRLVPILAVLATTVVTGLSMPGQVAAVSSPPGGSGVSAAARTVAHPAAPGARPPATTPPAVTPPAVTPAAAPPSRPRSRCTSALLAHAIVVSIRRQRMWVCHHSRLVMTTPVTTGAVDRGWRTPVGTWHVTSKARNISLVGASWDDHVHYWIQYDGTIGIHDAPWQRFPEGSTSEYRRHGSHGCVHLPEAAMRRVYDWSVIGTQVTVRSG